MAAAPQRFVLTLEGRSGGRTLSGYASDVANTFCTLSASTYAGTGADNNYIAQSAGVISGASITTGLTDTKAFSVVINGVPVGQIVDYVSHVSTVADRPKLRIPFGAGAKIQLLQVA